MVSDPQGHLHFRRNLAIQGWIVPFSCYLALSCKMHMASTLSFTYLSVAVHCFSAAVLPLLPLVHPTMLLLATVTYTRHLSQTFFNIIHALLNHLSQTFLIVTPALSVAGRPPGLSRLWRSWQDQRARPVDDRAIYGALWRECVCLEVEGGHGGPK